MKKALYLAAVLFAAFSCAKTEFVQVDNVIRETKDIRIHASVPQTKAVHGTGTEEGLSFTWEAEKDDINLLWVQKESGYSYVNGPARFKNVKSGAVACFEPEEKLYEPISLGDSLFAIYPFKASASYNWYDSEKGETVMCFRTSFGSTMQVGDNNTSHLDKFDIMVSKPVALTADMVQSDGSYDIPMEFAHLFSKLRVNVVNNTEAPFSVKSLVYHSTKTDDLMSGVIYMNMKTHTMVSEAREYGDCASSSNAILQTSDIEIPVGGSATLWMWIMPLDFTAGNAAGRKANIYLNTSAGVFHVDGVNFDQAFKAGLTYRHKFSATASKKMTDYTFIPDASFVEALYSSTFDYEFGSQMKFYDFGFNEVDMSQYDPWGFDSGLDSLCAGGLFVRNSEVAAMTRLELMANNAVSLEGIQAFTGLKDLSLLISKDMSSVLSVRSLDISSLTELESMDISNSQISFFDLSSNTKLKSLSIDFGNDLSSIKGLKNHPALESLVLNQVGLDAGGFSADLSGCPKLKYVDIGCDVKNLDLSGLALEELSLATSDYSGVNMSGLKASSLVLYYAPALPAIPNNVRNMVISNPQSISDGICRQLGLFSDLDTLHIDGWLHFGFDIEFGPENSSIKCLEIGLSEGYDAENQGGSICGFENLTGVDSLVVNVHREEGSAAAAMSADFSAMTQCRYFDVLFGKYFSVENLKLPASNVLKEVNMSFGDDNFPSMTIGNLAALEELTIQITGKNSSEHIYYLGNLPSLKDLSFYAKDACAVPVFSTKSYPSLSRIVLASKYVPFFPIYSEQSINLNYSQPEWLQYTHDAFPELAELYFPTVGGECASGINVVDLRPYSKLTRFNCFWQYYNASMEKKQRMTESVWITKSQETYTNTTSPQAYSVYWYGNRWYNGTINVTDPLKTQGGYSFGGYAKVMDDIDFK